MLIVIRWIGFHQWFEQSPLETGSAAVCAVCTHGGLAPRPLLLSLRDQTGFLTPPPAEIRDPRGNHPACLTWHFLVWEAGQILAGLLFALAVTRLVFSGLITKVALLRCNWGCVFYFYFYFAAVNTHIVARNTLVCIQMCNYRPVGFQGRPFGVEIGQNVICSSNFREQNHPFETAQAVCSFLWATVHSHMQWLDWNSFAVWPLLLRSFFES